MNMTNANSTSLLIPVDTVLKSVDEDEFLLEGDEITIYRQIGSIPLKQYLLWHVIRRRAISSIYVKTGYYLFTDV